MQFFNIIIFLIVVVCMTGVGLFGSRKVHNEDEYLLASRKTSMFALVATLVMTEFNTATLIAFSAAGYAAGWWGVTLPLVFLVGLMFYAFVVAKRWKRWNGMSVSHYFSERYGKDIGIFAAVILFGSMIGFSATYVKALSETFLPVFPDMNLWVLSGMLVLVILSMSIRGGLVSIIRIDILSFLIVLLFFPILLYFAWQMPVVAVTESLTLKEMHAILPPGFVTSLILLTMFSYILAPWYGQKVVAAKTEKIAYRAVMYAGILVTILYGIGVLATWVIKMKGIILPNPESGLPYLIYHALPKGLQGFAYGVLFCISATTLSGVWSAMVALITGHGKTKEMERPVALSIWLVCLCSIFSWLGANLFIDQILDKLILANIPVIALSFALLAGFYWKKTSRVGVYASIVTGLAWGTGCYLIYGEEGMYTWYWAVYGIPLIFIVGILGSLLFPVKPHHPVRPH